MVIFVIMIVVNSKKFNNKCMLNDIEIDFIANYKDEARQCQHCASFVIGDGEPYCAEHQITVPPTGHCNFFESID